MRVIFFVTFVLEKRWLWEQCGESDHIVGSIISMTACAHSIVRIVLRIVWARGMATTKTQDNVVSLVVYVDDMVK